MSAADPLAALAAYLKSTSVNGVVSGRVYRPKLPAGTAATMPVGCVVIRPAGGYSMFGGALFPLGDPRVDFVCYGSSDQEAGGIAREVVMALRALRQSVWPSASTPGAPKVRLYPARIEMGPVPLVDPDTDWPCVFLSAQVPHTEPALT